MYDQWGTSGRSSQDDIIIKNDYFLKALYFFAKSNFSKNKGECRVDAEFFTTNAPKFVNNFLCVYFFELHFFETTNSGGATASTMLLELGPKYIF